LDRIEDTVPGLRTWHRAQYRRHFEKFYQWERLFHGVYPTWAAAVADIPNGRPIGYDNPESSTFLGRSSPMLPSEYPILFWLASLLREQHTVFDFGGYLGLSYNWYRPYLTYPESLRWIVYDVPAVVREGQQILAREPDAHLQFTDDFTRAAEAGILLASGSLQFAEPSFAAMLAALSTRPPHLLINKVPLADNSKFFTLNNTGPAIAPYKIERRADFLASLEALGYTLIDSWKNPELACFIPLHPEASISAFDGFYFRQK
jgi:putative methyltransferase (TIGR04325 family)